MRIIAFILSIIVLALSCLPCADAGHGNINEGTVKSKQVQTTSQDEDQDHEDVCSPFCQCSCCAGRLANASFPYYKSITFPVGKPFTSYIPAGTIEISLPVWQPPQLV